MTGAAGLSFKALTSISRVGGAAGAALDSETTGTNVWRISDVTYPLASTAAGSPVVVLALMP